MMKKWIVALMSLLFTLTVWAQQNYIPPRAYEHRDTIKAELDRLFPTIPRYNYIPALIEHESCVTLRSKKCWSSMSQLKTQRELGVGLGQITKAFNQDGSLRFDALTEMRNRYRLELGELNWQTVYQRPDMQIRVMLLMSRENYNKLYDVPDPFQRLAMTDAAYNGGYGGLQKQRRNCSLIKGCNPNIWFGHLEKHSIKSKKILYGNRSAADINTHHVHDVLLVRMPKYEKFKYL